MTGPNRSTGIDGLPAGLRVLLADNEISTRRAWEASLRIAGFDVSAADDGEEAMQLALHDGFDIIVVDLDLPVKDGLMVCQELRASQVHTPFVTLSARDLVEERLQAFAAGAEDCLTKPFNVMELIARIRAVMMRTLAAPGSLATHVYEFGDLRVDTLNAAVWRGNARLRLSMMEYELLQHLVRHPGEILPRERILKEVWNSGPDVGRRAVDVHVGWLRKKIGDDGPRPRWIRTVHGQGYSFTPE